MTPMQNESGATEVVESKRKPPKFETRMLDDTRAETVLSGDFSAIQKAVAGSGVLDGLVYQIAQLGSYRKPVDDAAGNFVLGFVDAMNPRDPAKALLCTQMAAIHQATMMMAERLNRADSLPQQESAERALNKLSRSFAALMEALRKHRNGGKQTVTVQHVNVSDGGQAVVGNVELKGGSHCEK